jgi:hypothetical protein
MDEYEAEMECYWQGKTEDLGRKTHPNETFSTVNRTPGTAELVANWSLRGEKPMTKHMNYTARPVPSFATITIATVMGAARYYVLCYRNL